MPTPAATAPASACPIGIRPMERSASIEATRARRSGRTCCCIAVSQSALPMRMEAPRIAAATTTTGRGNGRTSENGSTPQSDQIANAVATGCSGRIR